MLGFVSCFSILFLQVMCQVLKLIPYYLTMIFCTIFCNQERIPYSTLLLLFQNHSTRHGEISLQVFDKGSPKILHNNIGYCHYPWLPPNTSIAEDTAHLRHRIWRHESETDLKVSILRTSSHSIRRFYATKKEEKLVVLAFSNVYKPDQ